MFTVIMAFVVRKRGGSLRKLMKELMDLMFGLG